MVIRRTEPRAAWQALRGCTGRGETRAGARRAAAGAFTVKCLCAEASERRQAKHRQTGQKTGTVPFQVVHVVNLKAPLEKTSECRYLPPNFLKLWWVTV